MIDILITSFVAAFITIALFGHVMVAKALITPDRNGVQRHLQRRRCQHPGSDLRPGRL